MDEAEIRLKLIERVHRIDQSPDSNVETAKVYENYVLGLKNSVPAVDKSTKKSSTSAKQTAPERQPG